MKTQAGLVAVACALLAAGGLAPVAAQAPGASPVASPVAGGGEFGDIGLASPESILYDPVADVYLISNLNGNPGEADDNGFITRLSPDGEVLAERWIDGAADNVELSAPKGSAIVEETLYVADITAIRLFDRERGIPIGSIEIHEATFLNDLAAGPDGAVYASDMGLVPNEAGELEPSGSDAVYRIDQDGTVTAIARTPDVVMPNGLAVLASGEVAVAPFLESGEVYALDAAGQRRDLGVVPGGALDGAVALPDGSLLVSSWTLPGVVRISPDGEVTTVIEGVASPADIGYDSTRNLLLIPDMLENRIVTVPILD